MKKLIEVENGGLLSLLDENVLVFCVNYIYTGKLTGVNDDCIQLSDAQIVYETGDFQQAGFKDAQPLPTSEWFIQLASIESLGRAK